MKTKTKLIEVKLAMILVVAVPEGSSGDVQLSVVKGEMKKMGYDKCDFALVVDDCEENPGLVDEII